MPALGHSRGVLGWKKMVKNVEQPAEKSFLKIVFFASFFASFFGVMMCRYAQIIFYVVDIRYNK